MSVVGPVQEAEAWFMSPHGEIPTGAAFAFFVFVFGQHAVV